MAAARRCQRKATSGRGAALLSLILVAAEGAVEDAVGGLSVLPSHPIWADLERRIVNGQPLSGGELLEAHRSHYVPVNWFMILFWWLPCLVAGAPRRLLRRPARLGGRACAVAYRPLFIGYDHDHV